MALENVRVSPLSVRQSFDLRPTGIAPSTRDRIPIMPSLPSSPLPWALIVALIVVVFLGIEVLRQTKQAHQLRRQLGDLPVVRRRQEALQVEINFLAGFVKGFGLLSQDLHSRLKVREIPNEVRDFLDRTFHPDEVIVLLSRKPSHSDPDKADHLIVASSKETTVQIGETIRLGTGQMGRAALTRRALDQTALEALLDEFSPGEVDSLFPFRASLSAPMSIGERVLGVIAISKPRWGSMYAKAALDLAGQISAVALSNAVALNEIRSESEIDPLTRIYHKGALAQRLALEVAKSNAEDTDLSVFLMDIDHFKNYNDMNGHLAGDELLKQLSELVLDETRAQDVFGRFGGEEFLLILPGRSSEIAGYVAEEIRQRIEGHLFPHGREQPLGKLTISGGIASKGHLVQTSNDLLTAADAALYRAKQSGRNRVLVSQSSFEPAETK